MAGGRSECPSAYAFPFASIDVHFPLVVLTHAHALSGTQTKSFGWIRVRDVHPLSEQPKGKELRHALVERSKQLLGWYYFWGGRSAFVKDLWNDKVILTGVDCSGMRPGLRAMARSEDWATTHTSCAMVQAWWARSTSPTASCFLVMLTPCSARAKT